MPSELSHPYQLDESTLSFILRGFGGSFSLLFHFNEIFVSKEKSPRYEWSVQNLHCLSRPTCEKT